MSDILTGYLSRISDAGALEAMASDLNARADVLASDNRDDALAWSAVYRVLAVSAETAVLARRTGVSL